MLDQLSGGRIEFGAGLGYAPARVQGVRLPRVAPRVAHRGVPRHPAPGVVRGGVQLPRQALRLRRRARLPRPRAARRPAAVAGRCRAVRASGGPCASAPTSCPRARCRCSTPGARRSIAAGGDPSAKRVGIIRSFLVTDDPERDWPPLRAAERYRMAVYGGFFEAAGLGNSGTFNELERINQRVFVGNVAECVDRADGVRPALRADRRRHVGLGAGPATCRPDAVDGALRRRGRAAGPRRPRRDLTPSLHLGGICLWAGSVPEAGTTPAQERFPPRSGDRRDYSSSGVARGRR